MRKYDFHLGCCDISQFQFQEAGMHFIISKLLFAVQYFNQCNKIVKCKYDITNIKLWDLNYKRASKYNTNLGVSMIILLKFVIMIKSWLNGNCGLE